MTYGRATGNSILKIWWNVLNPIPFAASIISGSTDSTPAYVLRRRGNNEYKNKATTAGLNPIPKIGIIIANKAMVGTVWKIFAILNMKLFIFSLLSFVI